MKCFWVAYTGLWKPFSGILLVKLVTHQTSDITLTIGMSTDHSHNRLVTKMPRFDKLMIVKLFIFVCSTRSDLSTDSKQCLPAVPIKIQLRPLKKQEPLLTGLCWSLSANPRLNIFTHQQKAPQRQGRVWLTWTTQWPRHGIHLEINYSLNEGRNTP